MFQTEYNARVHALAMVIAVSTGFLLGIDRLEWVALVLTIAAVWSLEAVNTAIANIEEWALLLPKINKVSNP